MLIPVVSISSETGMETKTNLKWILTETNLVNFFEMRRSTFNIKECIRNSRDVLMYCL